MLSPLPFALVLLSIEWARSLGEMIMVRRASSQVISAATLGKKLKFFKATIFLSHKKNTSLN
jgi:hypothetical protein